MLVGCFIFKYTSFTYTYYRSTRQLSIGWQRNKIEIFYIHVCTFFFRSSNGPTNEGHNVIYYLFFFASHKKCVLTNAFCVVGRWHEANEFDGKPLKNSHITC